MKIDGREARIETWGDNCGRLSGRFYIESEDGAYYLNRDGTWRDFNDAEFLSREAAEAFLASRGEQVHPLEASDFTERDAAIIRESNAAAIDAATAELIHHYERSLEILRNQCAKFREAIMPGRLCTDEQCLAEVERLRANHQGERT